MMSPFNGGQAATARQPIEDTAIKRSSVSPNPCGLDVSRKQARRVSIEILVRKVVSSVSANTDVVFVQGEVGVLEVWSEQGELSSGTRGEARNEG